jgi:glycosyltransferase involved in cell wall biosynthesis
LVEKLGLTNAKPRIFLLVPTFRPHDAVGNDILAMYHVLRDAGYETTVFAEQNDTDVASITRKPRLRSNELWGDPQAILIYHHAIEWKLGEDILRRSRNKVVIKYHNVTPPEYFAPYAQAYYRSCAGGVEATARLAKLRVDFVWGDSQFNTDEFIGLGVPRERCRVLPPLHRIEDLGRAPLDSVIAGAYRGVVPNILFVGAFRPNKGHLKALDTFAAWRRLTGSPARLLLVGSMDPVLKPYRELVAEHARALGIEDSVFMAHSVTLSQLRTCYSVADVFLCVSEHEGFCVPLVEAMYFRVPIVAWNTTAVGETCGGCGRIYPEFDPDALAQAIDGYLADPSALRRAAEEGRRRYETVFQRSVLERRFLDLIREVEAL